MNAIKDVAIRVYLATIIAANKKYKGDDVARLAAHDTAFGIVYAALSVAHDKAEREWDDRDAARAWLEQGANSDDPDAMFNLGVLAEEAGDLDAARAWWEKAATLGDEDAMLNLGWLAREAGDLDAARAWFEQDAKLGNPEAMTSLGVLAKDAGDLDAARAWWEKAVKFSNPEAMTNLGLLAEEAGNLDAARAWYEQAAKLDYLWAMSNLGRLTYEAGDLDAARAWYEQAANPDDSNAMFNLGALAEEMGDLDAARTWYEQAAKLDQSARERSRMDYVVMGTKPNYYVLYRVYGFEADELLPTADSWKRSRRGMGYELAVENDERLTESGAAVLAASWGVPLMFRNGLVPPPIKRKNPSVNENLRGDLGDYTIVDPETPPDTEPS